MQTQEWTVLAERSGSWSCGWARISEGWPNPLCSHQWDPTLFQTKITEGGEAGKLNSDLGGSAVVEALQEMLMWAESQLFFCEFWWVTPILRSQRTWVRYSRLLQTLCFGYGNSTSIPVMFFFFRSPLDVAGFFQRQKLFVSDFCLCSVFFVSVAIAQYMDVGQNGRPREPQMLV